MLLNQRRARAQLKFLVYGPSGTSKTSMLCTMPNPVLLIAEHQAWPHVLEASKRLNRPPPPAFLIESREQVWQAFKALYAADPLEALVRVFVPEAERETALARMPYRTIESVGIDSVTELMNIIRRNLDAEAPPKTGKDGLPAPDKRRHGVILDRSEGLVAEIRKLPFHTVMTAQVDDREVGSEKDDTYERIYRPSTPSARISTLLYHNVNCIGVTERRRVERKRGDEVDIETEWCVRFVTPSWKTSKVMRPLEDVEVPDVTAWIEKLALVLEYSAPTKEE